MSSRFLPESLLSGLRDGTAIPFVGAGVSASVVASDGNPLFPTWAKLLDLAAARMEAEALTAEARQLRACLDAQPPDYYGAAERARAALGPHWATFLKQRLDPDRSKLDEASLELARTIWRLGSALVITTNYDRVLSWAHPAPADLQRWMIEAKAEQAALLRTPLKRPTIWHLHGHIDDVANLVLTPDSYDGLYDETSGKSRYPGAIAALRALLAGRSLLFTGFSLQDAAFSRVFEDVWEAFGGFGGPHYIVVREAEADSIAKLVGARAKLITFSDFGPPLLELLQELASKVGRAARQLQPAFEDATSERLSHALFDCYARRQVLASRGQDSAQLALEIRDLQRQLREGGSLRAGDLLCDGRYLLIEHLGSGGFGMVWRADDLARGIQVAIKVLHPENAREPQRRARFYRGARSMAELDHPNVVRVLDGCVEEAGWHYYVMEYVPGGELRPLGTQRLHEIVALIVKVGEALNAAHARRLIHRDVKPANILLTDAGDPKLTDFDLVKTQTSIAKTRAEAVGALGYAAPETLRDASSVDERADIFSLAMTTLFLLVGSDLALEDPSRRALQIAGLAVPPALKATLSRALDFNARARHASVREFCEALAQASVAPVAETELSLPAPAPLYSRKELRRHVRTASLVSVLTVLVGFAVRYRISHTGPTVTPATGGQPAASPSAKVPAPLSSEPGMLKPLSGNRSLLTLYAFFADQVARLSAAELTHRVFDADNPSSLSSYLNEVSYEKLKIQGKVIGPLNTSKTRAYYTAGQSGLAGSGPSLRTLVEDVLKLSSKSVNFADYDSDHDGTLDQLLVIGAGDSASKAGPSNMSLLWGNIGWQIEPQQLDGARIKEFGFLTDDAVLGEFASRVLTDMAHLPPLYANDGRSSGVGVWGIHASGAFGGSGQRPVHPTVWEKAKLAWLVPKAVPGDGAVSLAPFAFVPDALRIPIGGSDQYLLVSFRGRMGFDVSLPAGGVLIERVDERQKNNSDSSHYLVEIMECDGRHDLRKGSNQGDASDAFPCLAPNPINRVVLQANGAKPSDAAVEISDIQVGDNRATLHVRQLLHATDLARVPHPH